MVGPTRATRGRGRRTPAVPSDDVPQPPRAPIIWDAASPARSSASLAPDLRATIRPNTSRAGTHAASSPRPRSPTPSSPSRRSLPSLGPSPRPSGRGARGAPRPPSTPGASTARRHVLRRSGELEGRDEQLRLAVEVVVHEPGVDACSPGDTADGGRVVPAGARTRCGRRPGCCPAGPPPAGGPGAARRGLVRLARRRAGPGRPRSGSSWLGAASRGAAGRTRAPRRGRPRARPGSPPAGCRPRRRRSRSVPLGERPRTSAQGWSPWPGPGARPWPTRGRRRGARGSAGRRGPRPAQRVDPGRRGVRQVEGHVS